MRMVNGLLAGFFLFLTNTCISQELHRIMLKIDTKNASPGEAIHWSVSDNTSVLNLGEKGAFTIFARVGDNISWKMVSLSQSDVPVDIIQIQYVKGPRIFSRDLIKGEKDTKATVIRGGKEDYSYLLRYRIGNLPGEYTTTARIRIID